MLETEREREIKVGEREIEEQGRRMKCDRDKKKEAHESKSGWERKRQTRRMKYDRDRKKEREMRETERGERVGMKFGKQRCRHSQQMLPPYL